MWIQSAKAMRALAGRALGVLIGLWLRTLKLTIDGPPLAGDAVVLAFFHGRQFALLRWPRPSATAVLVSYSADGDLQTALMASRGLVVLRGSSSRGAATGMRRLIRHGRRGGAIALAVDGPRGPQGASKPGTQFLAARIGARIVPLGSAVSSGWLLRRTWDRMLIPHPFARVAVVLGEPLQAEISAAELDAAIECVTQRACALARR